MGVFFIDTSGGQIATERQLIAAGLASADEPPPRPWLRIQGPSDASTMWYAVLRKSERGIFMGQLVVRHTGYRDLLLERGWEEIAIDDIHAPGGPPGSPNDRETDPTASEDRPAQAM